LGGDFLSLSLRRLLWSRRPFIAEAQVRSHVSPYNICPEQSATAAGFRQSTLVLPVGIIPSVLHTHLLLHVAFTRWAKGEAGSSPPPPKGMLIQKSGSIG